MSFNKKFFTTGGIVASSPAEAAFDPLANFETVTYTGNGGTKKVNGYIRKGAAFNGSSSYISLPSLGLLPTSDNTVSFWIYPETQVNSSPTLVSLWTDLHLEVRILSSLEVQAVYRSGGSFAAKASGFNLNLNQWNFVSMSYEYGVGFEFFVNGSTSTQAFTGTINNTGASGSSKIGTYAAFTNGYFTGKLDQVRIFNRALDETTDGEVTTLYNEDYDSSTKSTTDIFGDGSGIALYEFEDSARSSNFGQAASFNGSSSKIVTSIPSSTFTSDFSASFWFNPSNVSTSSGEMPISFLDNLYIQIYLSKIRIQSYDTNYDFIESSTLNNGTWYHFLVTRSGNNYEAFLNGSSIGTMTSATLTTATNAPNIGNYSYNNTQYYDGKIDQLRIYSSALDSDDVAELYAESADVPTTNLVAHYKLDGNANDETDTYDGTASNVTYAGGVYSGTPTDVDFLGMAFQPDFVWIKAREASASHGLFDSVRGENNIISSESTSAESDLGSHGVTSFDTNGFSVSDVSSGANAVNGSAGGTYSGSGAGYVAWCWKAGGTVSADNNSDGDITSTVSANQDAGFSIVKYTGNSSFGQSVGHGLSQAPEIIFFKNLSINRDWRVYNHTIGATKYLQLDSNVGAGTFGSFNNTDPTSDVFYTTNGASADTATNNNGNNFIAYCFHSVNGYQKVGSFQGTGSTLPNTITGLGFQPRFLLLKNSTGAYEWVIKDSVRGAANELYPNDSTAENGKSDVSNITFNSDGFSINVADGATNQNNATIIYLAIA